MVGGLVGGCVDGWVGWMLAWVAVVVGVEGEDKLYSKEVKLLSCELLIPGVLDLGRKTSVSVAYWIGVRCWK